MIRLYVVPPSFTRTQWSVWARGDSWSDPSPVFKTGHPILFGDVVECSDFVNEYIKEHYDSIDEVIHAVYSQRRAWTYEESNNPTSTQTVGKDRE